MKVKRQLWYKLNTCPVYCHRPFGAKSLNTLYIYIYIMPPSFFFLVLLFSFVKLKIKKKWRIQAKRRILQRRGVQSKSNLVLNIWLSNWTSCKVKLLVEILTLLEPETQPPSSISTPIIHYKKGKGHRR